MKIQPTLHHRQYIHFSSNHHVSVFNESLSSINLDVSYLFQCSCSQNASSSTEMVNQMNLVNSSVSQTGSFALSPSVSLSLFVSVSHAHSLPYSLFTSSLLWQMDPKHLIPLSLSGASYLSSHIQHILICTVSVLNVTFLRKLLCLVSGPDKYSLSTLYVSQGSNCQL